MSGEVIEDLASVGVDCFRINTAYGSIGEYKDWIELVRSVTDVPVMLDLKGPEIRIKGDKTKSLFVGTEFDVGFTGEDGFRFNHDLSGEISVGDRVLIDNGEIETVVKQKDSCGVVLRSLDEGQLYGGKGVNFPNKKIDTPALSERDRRLVELGVDFDVEYYAHSFTRSRSDVEELYSCIDGRVGGVIAKIENKDGLNSFREILDVVDGVMVARGDLGIELSIEKVPMVQKRIIKQCNMAGVPVVTATEVLESMIEKPRPTRAEVSDAANAILDGTDCIMLSGETSIGRYPVKSVEVLRSVASEVECEVENTLDEVRSNTIPESISKAVNRLCRDMKLDKVVALTKTGYTPRMISRFRVRQPIITVTPDEHVLQKQKIIYGVVPVQTDFVGRENQVLFVGKKLLEKGLLDEDDTVLFTSTSKKPIEKEGDNLIEIHKIDELDFSGLSC
ncbi:pyruvate kinase [Methanonatronarchaeum sp. AMET6-2]|nr:pyruvate kinase [Methanonatronarchaeum sp. AMET6-2]